MSWPEKLNVVLRSFGRLYVTGSYYRKILGFRLRCPDLFRCRDRDFEKEHRRLWRPLWRDISLDWARYYANISGVCDPRYVPETVFYVLVERILNDVNFSWVFGDKNSYDLRLGAGSFPSTVLHCVGGDFLDDGYRMCTERRAREALAGHGRDVVVKPSIDSGGGKNVRIYAWDGNAHVYGGTPLDLSKVARELGGNYIVQDRVGTHEFCARFNPESVNTFRIMTLRLPDSEEVVPLKAALRLGVGDTPCDNMTAGGVSVGVSPDGSLSHYGCTYYGRRCDRHPVTGVGFAGKVVPQFADMVRTACDLARRTPALRLLSFDMVLLPDGRVQCLEVNCVGQGINLLQNSGGGLFGGFTEGIIEYCAANRRNDRFRMFRLFAV